MKGLKTLVLMQLKNKVDFSFIKSVKQTIFKVVLSLIKFVLITFLIFIVFYALNLLKFVSILPGIPQNFISVVFSIMFLLSVIVCTFGLMKSLYFSKDNAFLLTMPTNKLGVFISKLIVYYIYELIRNITYFLPVFIAYGLINKLPVYFYLWLVVMLFLITALIVAVSSLLSILAMLITKFISDNKWLEYILVAMAITAVVLVLIYIIDLIPLNIDLIGTWGSTYWRIQEFMEKFIKIFYPLTLIVTAIVGKRYGTVNLMFRQEQIFATLGIIGAIVIIFGLTFLIVKPIFFNMVSFPFEYKKKQVKHQHGNKNFNYFWTSIKKEAKLTYRTSEKFYGLLFVIIGMPIAIFLLNKIYSAMDTRLAGTFMTIAFNIMVILLFALSSNVPLSHIYSEEGASSYLLKTFPKSYLRTATAKLIINTISVAISVLVSVIIFTQFTTLSALQTTALYFALLFVFLAHMLWVVESDIMHPQTAHYKTTGGHSSNPNEIKAVLKASLLSAVFAFIVYFLIPENRLIVWYKLLLVATIFLALRIWLYINKVNIYFKERE